MKSGRIVERRDQVLITFFSFLSFMPLTLTIRWSSTNGPLCTERPMLPLLRLAVDNHIVGPLVISGLEAACRLTPWSHRMTATRGFTFTTTRVIDRVHRNAAVVRHAAEPTGFTRLAERHVFMLNVTHLTNRRHAFHQHLANFTGRQFEQRVFGFPRNQLRLR